MTREDREILSTDTSVVIVDRTSLKFLPPVSYSRLLISRRPIMSVLATRPDTAFLKGGLFKKFGFDLPQPVQQQWTRRCEKWETLVPGIKVIE
jgi:hypothetical protein